ncbi:MAG: monomeric [FeFe] hydrogenase [Planctomycetia bacterium]|nr:monomeric [FeFe] hydrogenase [Planctomycetia bacterium]
MINGAQYIRRELLIRLVRAFDEGILEEELDRIPIRMRPKDGPSSRCCVYHDRAVLRYRLINLLGFSCEEETDETRSLASYFREAAARTEVNGENPLSACSAGCSACPDAKIMVTGNCRGCFARPCMYNCPKQAIRIENQTAAVDDSKCVKCGKCLAVCPFHAIVKTTVPCEEACPVGAIRKDESGKAAIDFEKCIFCGKCFSACPFSAIMERSQIIDVLTAMKQKEKMIALVAPSAAAQFPGSIEQLFTAISKVGFDDVCEAALGAEKTAENEAREFQKKMSEKQIFMTTSCCPAYTELVRKHCPDFLQYVSTTPSPMIFTDRIAREKHPNARTVFIGPCIAKRVEAHRNGIDFVLSFEELGAILAGRRIDVIACDPWPLPRPASVHARNFAKSCGVTQAILAETDGFDASFKLDGKFINGIGKKTLPLLKFYASGKDSLNFLEVMSCEGGCVNGPTSLTKNG